jgi:hypothetical protein
MISAFGADFTAETSASALERFIFGFGVVRFHRPDRDLGLLPLLNNLNAD